MVVPSEVAVLAIFIPVVIAVLSHLVAKSSKGGSKLAKAICILASYITLFLVSLLIFEVQYTPIRMQLFTISLPTGSFNVGLYVDYLALVPAFFSSLFTALALTYNVYYLSPYNRAYKVGWEFNRSYSFILLFNGAMLGALFSNNLLSLLIFWELVSVCSYALISFWSEDLFCLWASLKSFIMTHVGGVALLMATVIIYSVAGTLEISEIAQKTPIGNPAVLIILPLLLVAAMPKAKQFPLHTWLPDSTFAPTSAVVVFQVCGFQSAIYLIVRFFHDVFRTHIVLAPAMPLPPLFGNVNIWGFAISFIGAITIIIGALNGLFEDDFKRIVTYCTISQLGYITMTVGIMTPLGCAAGLSLMVSHASSLALLFFCAGAVIHQTGKHSINEVEGLYTRMPITATCCAIGALALSMMPGLGVFASKYLVYHSILDSGGMFFIIVAFLGSVLNIALLIRLFHSVFMGKKTGHDLGNLIHDPPLPMVIPMVVLSGIVIILGVFPQIPMDPLIIPWIRQLGHQVPIIETPYMVITSLGFWEPLTVGASIFGLSLILLFATNHSSKMFAREERKAERAEEAFEPFLCGEDSKSLDATHGYHFYHALTNVLKVDVACHVSNIDRAYNALSKRFFDFCRGLLHFDIQQNYFAAVLCFVVGAAIVVLIAVLAG